MNTITHTYVSRHDLDKYRTVCLGSTFNEVCNTLSEGAVNKISPAYKNTLTQSDLK